MQLIDLSHTIKPGMPSFSATTPQPKIRPWLSHEQAAQSGRYEGCSCEITEMHFITSVGTYLDSPYHFFSDRAAIEGLTLDQLVLPGVVIDCSGLAECSPITPDALAGVDLQGKAVLFRADWSQHWGKPKYARYPYLTGETATALQEGGAELVGVDFMVVDDVLNPRRPVHVTLLKNDIVIVENLTNLAELPPEGFTFHAVPAKVKGAAAFPVRAYAVIP